MKWIFVFLTLPAFALPKTSQESINGFDVEFIDVGSGNTLGVSFYVPYGTMHDAGRFLGRAHLLEHIVHAGTLRFPGYETFRETTRSLGIMTNAYTADDHTFYHASAHIDQAENMLPIFLSLLGGLEWNPKTIADETQVVIREIAQEDNVTEAFANWMMPFTQLLRPEHPWSKPALGDTDSLNSLTTDDLKHLYSQVYRRGVARIQVYANFSQPGARDKIRKLVQASLKAPPGRTEPDPMVLNKKIPSLIVENEPLPVSHRRIFIATDQTRGGSVTLQADPAQISNLDQAIRSLAANLSLPLPGSLIHRLKSEVELVTDASVFSSRVRNMHLLSFHYQLSDKGAGQNRLVEQMFFQALREMQEHEIDPAQFTSMQDFERKKLELQTLDVDSALSVYGQILASHGSLDAYVEQNGKLTTRDVRAAARHFRPEMAIYQEHGPAVAEMDFDPIFKRQFKLRDNRGHLEHLIQIMLEPGARHFNPRFSPVDLGALGEAQTPSLTWSKPGQPGFAVDSRAKYSDSAVSVNFELNGQNAEVSVASDLILAAFEERYAGELIYLSLKYFTNLQAFREGRYLRISSIGKDAYTSKALAWYLDRLSEFEPTMIELDRARAQYRDAHLHEYLRERPAILALRQLRLSLNPLNPDGMTANGLAAALSNADIVQRWRSLRSGGAGAYAAVGSLAMAEIRAVQSSAQKLIPLGETTVLRTTPRTGSTRIPFAKAKGPEAYGMVRRYAGPDQSDVIEGLAFEALTELLSDQVFALNREKRQLGYVHAATTGSDVVGRAHLLIYGGTEGPANADLVIRGWEEIIAGLNLLDQAVWDDAVASVKSSYAQVNSTAQELAGEYLGGLIRHGDALAHRKRAEAAQRLTVADVKAVAKKYILDAGNNFTQLTLHGCDEELSH